MYLVPENLTPERIRGRYRQEDTFSLSEMDALLQNTRALPVEAGSVLVWNDKVIHWGATCVEPDEPRISISFELTGEDADRKDETSNGDDYITELNERLYVIGRAVRSYVRFEPLMKRYSSLAERLIDLKNR
jgi:ectoine hydroxylase-related dioxygenase (phytanoyl-CoA dioxygenase family)